MAFWNRNKKQKEEASAPIVVRRGKGNSGNRFPVEVKVLAARAKESGLDRKAAGAFDHLSAEIITGKDRKSNEIIKLYC